MEMPKMKNVGNDNVINVEFIMKEGLNHFSI
jgi:hypothetical protein